MKDKELRKCMAEIVSDYLSWRNDVDTKLDILPDTMPAQMLGDLYEMIGKTRTGGDPKGTKCDKCHGSGRI